MRTGRLPCSRRRASLGVSTSMVALLTTFSVCMTAGSANAQAPSVRALCTNHGPNTVEPIVGREGQSFLAAEATCQIQGGPMDGAIDTQSVLWHYDKGSGTLVSGHSVARLPDSIATAVITSGSLTFQMADSKVTGWTASGKGRYALGAGAAASLGGKTFAWTASPTGPQSYAVVLSVEQ